MAEEHAPEHVRRHVDIDLDPDEAWELVIDDGERSAWFGGETTIDPVPGGGGEFTDPDGTRRSATVETVEPPRRLSWTWWPEGEEQRTSRVEVELEPVPGGTRVSVTESPLAPVARRRPGTLTLAA